MNNDKPEPEPAMETVSLRRRGGALGPGRDKLVSRAPTAGAPIVPRDNSRERTVGAILAPLGLRGPLYMHALEAATHDLPRLASLWLEIGDALAALGRGDKARFAWLDGLGVAERAGRASRAIVPSYCWRLAQVAESMRELAEAAAWYERAADQFSREGSKADEATARMALTRVTLHLSGAGLARQLAREAVAVARESEDRALFAQALAMSGEVSFDLGVLDEAIPTLRDALRLYGEIYDVVGQVGVAVSLADALLESGQSLPALAALEVALPSLESHESLEVRGRGMGLLGLVNLDVGDYKGATAALEKAHEWLDAANAPLRRARLLVATARRVHLKAGAGESKTLYEQAWRLAQLAEAGERFRLAPIAYALARCQHDLGDYVRADDTIGLALQLVQESGDLEGMARCTELGVRIAARLHAGKIALERLIVLARTQARLGQVARALTTLRNALEATMNLPDGDVAVVCAEYMDLARQKGVDALGPTEALETAEVLASAELLPAAAELAALDAERQLANGRLAEAAKTFAKAANWSAIHYHRTRDTHARGESVDLWDRGIALAEQVGMSDAEGWRAERSLISEA